MAYEYKLETHKRKVLDKVTCDGCGFEFKKESEAHWNEYGRPHTNFFEPMFTPGWFELKHSWGYHSNKDSETHRAVICEPCYDKIFKDVKITVTNYF